LRPKFWPDRAFPKVLKDVLESSSRNATGPWVMTPPKEAKKALLTCSLGSVICVTDDTCVHVLHLCPHPALHQCFFCRWSPRWSPHQLSSFVRSPTNPSPQCHRISQRFGESLPYPCFREHGSTGSPLYFPEAIAIELFNLSVVPKRTRDLCQCLSSPSVPYWFIFPSIDSHVSLFRTCWHP